VEVLHRLRLVLQPKSIDRLTGLDLIILEPDATLQDLVDAFDPYAGTAGHLHKLQLGGIGECKGCVNNCCHNSIIAPDPIGFESMRNHLGLTESEFLAERCDPDGLARGVVRLRSYPCTFLSAERTCTIYEGRALICRLFICCPLSPALENLLQNALGAGLAGLATRLQALGLLEPIHPEGYRSDNLTMAGYEMAFDRFYRRWVGRQVDPGEEMVPAWEKNPFDTARSYGEIPLWAFVTPDDWRELTRGGLAYPAAAPQARR
jgi:hypothetical protein